MKRLSWPQYFMDITRMVAERSTCTRRKVGAIAVKDKRILATGYNGAPKDIPDCFEVGCLRDKLKIPSGTRHELCRGIHAEQNVIVQAAIYGISIAEADVYCTHQPCFICAKLLINCDIRAIYYLHAYPDPLAEEILSEAGVLLEKHPEPTTYNSTLPSFDPR